MWYKEEERIPQQETNWRFACCFQSCDSVAAMPSQATNAKSINSFPEKLARLMHAILYLAN
jgi:hypothetical protein